MTCIELGELLHVGTPIVSRANEGAIGKMANDIQRNLTPGTTYFRD